MVVTDLSEQKRNEAILAEETTDHENPPASSRKDSILVPLRPAMDVIHSAVSVKSWLFTRGLSSDIETLGIWHLL